VINASAPFIEETLGAIAGGFVGWIAIQLTQYLVLRSRIASYLVVQINRKLWQLKQNRAWLKETLQTNAKEGYTIEGAARYLRDELPELSDIRELTLKFLSRDELERVTKFTSTFLEIEFLTEGFIDALRLYAAKKEPINEDDVKYLTAKAERLDSLIDAFPEKVARIRDLPLDYAGILGPRAVVIPPKKKTGHEV